VLGALRAREDATAARGWLPGCWNNSSNARRRTKCEKHDLSRAATLYPLLQILLVARCFPHGAMDVGTSAARTGNNRSLGGTPPQQVASWNPSAEPLREPHLRLRCFMGRAASLWAPATDRLIRRVTPERHPLLPTHGERSSYAANR
jgi:hypothetical protein